MAKKPYLNILFAFLGLGIALAAQAQPSSVLRTGDWYKLGIERHGVYKITYTELARMGIRPRNVDPKKIKLYSQPGGMLPQPNQAMRPTDLKEMGILVMGEEDGSFDPDDYILFYAEGPDRIQFNTSRDMFFYEKNLYDNHNYCFLTLQGTNGKRIVSVPDLGGGTDVGKFNDFVYHEANERNLLHSGREWVGERFDVSPELPLSFPAQGIVDNTPIRLVSDVVGQAYTNTTFRLLVNNVPVADQPVLPVAPSPYSAKGQHRRDTLTVNSTTVLAPEKASLDIKYQFIKSGSGWANGFLDFLLASFERHLALYGNQTRFLSRESLMYPVTRFTIAQMGTTSSVWDITDPFSPALQTLVFNANSASFSTSTPFLKTFVAFNARVPAPEFLGKVPNQDLHALSVPNLAIITHPLFKQEAQRLASHRQNHSGITATVVTTTEIYQEFSSGRQDVTAIRDFIKYLYDKNNGQLKNVLLFGKGSYDYIGTYKENTNFVPVYQSYNSTHPLETFSSDDYFGFLENNEGRWAESPPDNHTLDIGIGRLPVKTVTEAHDIVNKIIQYETDPASLGPWRKDIVLVADDGDFNLHQSQADQLAGMVNTNYPEYHERKVYLDAYPQIAAPAGVSSPETSKAIHDAFDRGALIINYTGHGSEKIWAQEKIFDDFMAVELNNAHLPFLVTATCEFGRHDDPTLISTAEITLLRPQGGAIGLVSTTRPVFSNTNFELNQAFYAIAFQRPMGQSLDLGEIFRYTKNNSLNGTLNRNFSLLGDPSLTLAYPQKKIKVSSIKTLNLSDTLKALSHVRVTGEITHGAGLTDVAFSGWLIATLYGNESSLKTLGNENSPFPYREWKNKIFQGKAPVVQGQFAFDCIVPQDAAQSLGQGKLCLYAVDPTLQTDAAGATLGFLVGGREPLPLSDNLPPVLKAFMGDTTFVNGGFTSPDTDLVVTLQDDHGINLSDYGLGHTLVGMLDGKTSFPLNDFYTADVGTYQSGTITYPLHDLAPGKHTITIKAWDTYNNPGETTVDFIVTEGEGIVIEEFSNYPNPFEHLTALFFTHNRAGDDLDVAIDIMDMLGNTVQSFRLDVLKSPYRVELGHVLQEGKKWSNAVYLARLRVRSFSNGSKNEKVAKLISIN